MEAIEGFTLFLFTMELYHLATHILVLFGLRLLPRKDLGKAPLRRIDQFLCIFLIDRKSVV